MDSTTPDSGVPNAVDAWAVLQTGVTSVVDAELTADEAARRADLDLCIPDKLGVDDPGIIDVLDALGRSAAVDLRLYRPGPLAPALIRRLAHLLASGEYLPGESSQPDLAWAWVRVLFGGFGYEQHSTVVRALSATHGHCPFTADEPVQDWLKSLGSARLLCGWPVGLVRFPWQRIAQAFGPTAGKPQGAPEFWLVIAAVCELAKYGRRGDRNGHDWFVYRGSAQDIRVPISAPNVPLSGGAGRSGATLYANIFKLTPVKAKEFHRPSNAFRAVISKLTLAAFERLKPMADVPKDWVLAPHPRLVPCAEEPGLVPVQLRAQGVWEMRITSGAQPQLEILVDPLAPSAHVFDYDWPDEAPTGADDEFAKRIPPKLTNYELPFDRILDVFPNAVPPVDDAEGYRALLNAALISPFMVSCREFPPVYICPHVPTDEGATATGKSTLAKALATVFSPALNDVGTIRLGNDGAPSARNILALIERHGTAALDEFLLSKDPDHPMSEAKILNLATGDSVSFGKALSNTADTVKLTAPLFLASKVVRGKIDMFNRSLRIELTPLTSAMDNKTYVQLTSGAWSTETNLHARAAALLYAGVTEITKDSLPYPPEHYRFHTIRALAVLLLARSENLPLDIATKRIDDVHLSIIKRHQEQLVKSMDTGLSVNAAESGTAMFTFDHLFGYDIMDDDVFLQAAALGNRPIRDYVKLACDSRGVSAQRLVGETYGDEFTGSERQLVIALNRSLQAALANGPAKLAGQRGLDGWHVTSKNLSDIRPKYALERIGAGSGFSAPVQGPVFQIPDIGLGALKGLP